VLNRWLHTVVRIQVKEMMSAALDTDGKVHYEDFAELLAED